MVTLYKVTNEILFELKIRHLLVFMIGWKKEYIYVGLSTKTFLGLNYDKIM